MIVFAGGRFCVWKYDGGPPCEFWPSEPKMEFWDSGELSCEKLRVQMAGRAAASGDVLEVRCGRDDRRRPEAVKATSRDCDAIVCG